MNAVARSYASFKTAPLLVAAAFIVVSITVLTGWVLGNPMLKAAVPGLTPMNPMTAICFLCLATGITLLSVYKKSWTVIGLMTVVAMIAGSRLVASSMGIDRSLDTVLFSSQLDRELQPNRMAVSTAWCHFTGALSLLLLAWPRRKASAAQALSLIPSLTGVIVVNCYIFAIVGSQIRGAAVPMALHTASLFAVFGIAVWTLSPNSGFAASLMQETNSAKLGRRMIMALMFVPPLVAIFANAAKQSGLYRSDYGEAILVTTIAIIFGGLIWVGTRESSKNELLARHAQDEASNANAAKSEFLSRMSHELRTPLNAVIGYAQLLEMTSGEQKTIDASKSIQKSGRHLLNLINEVLDMARIEAGKMTLSIEPVPLQHAIGQVMDLVRPLAEARKINVHLVTDSWDKLHVSADRQRLVQVLLNLLTNAVKYNREGGKIEVRCMSKEPGSVCIEIADTGYGMSLEGVQRLFKPFERVGDLTIEGTGLGLALSDKLATLMGANLHLISTSAEGSTFGVTLKPVAAPSASVLEIEDQARFLPKGDGPVLKIVYIEDNASNVKLLERVFDEVGNVELLPAILGSSGIDLVNQHMPDIIFLDLHLPDIHGAEVLSRLRANPRTAMIPVIVLSADATDSQIRRLMNAGVQAYLTKPLDLPSLFAEINKVKENLKKAA